MSFTPKLLQRVIKDETKPSAYSSYIEGPTHNNVSVLETEFSPDIENVCTFCFQYMTKLLSQGEGLEFFIEGGRTRTGKSMIPKGGLLSVVVEAFNEGE